MGASADKLINELKRSNLVAECPCGESFLLKDAILFDGKGALPKEAAEIKEALLLQLKERENELKKRKISADKGAEKKAMEVGIGKVMEKILPTCADFNIPICDCRPLFEPIDMLVFNGLSAGKIESITFMEIKTGASRLNTHQKAIKDAIEEKKVAYKEL
ncbi:MAG: hypothetical protein N3E51_04685 [Candidatus Micrarchaeota archaeon]|nr:hypothetical protein [Candidatus Micrarchaeota archaeon]